MYFCIYTLFIHLFIYYFYHRYGAQHPIVVLTPENDKNLHNYIVVGHCCESGDLFTPAPGEPEVLKPRLLNKVKLGDLVSIEGSGAYCAGMATKNYNSFPEAAEVMLDLNNDVHLIRRKQNLSQIIENEVPYTVK